MTLAAPAPFHNLRAFVFGEHALHLQQQIVFRTDADRAVEKHDIHTMLAQFIDQQHLVSITSREAIGGMNVQLLKTADIRHVAQPFQRRSHQCRTADTIIEEA